MSSTVHPVDDLEAGLDRGGAVDADAAAAKAAEKAKALGDDAAKAGMWRWWT